MTIRFLIAWIAAFMLAASPALATTGGNCAEMAMPTPAAGHAHFGDLTMTAMMAAAPGGKNVSCPDMLLSACCAAYVVPTAAAVVSVPWARPSAYRAANSPQMLAMSIGPEVPPPRLGA